jgi:hypothetical protein
MTARVVKLTVLKCGLSMTGKLLLRLVPPVIRLSSSIKCCLATKRIKEPLGLSGREAVDYLNDSLLTGALEPIVMSDSGS